MKNAYLIFTALLSIQAYAQDGNLNAVEIRNISKNSEHGRSLSISCVETNCESLIFNFHPYDGEWGSGSKTISVVELNKRIQAGDVIGEYSAEPFSFTRELLNRESMKKDIDQGKYLRYSSRYAAVIPVLVADLFVMPFEMVTGAANAGANGVYSQYRARHKAIRKFLNFNEKGITTIDLKDRQFKSYETLFKNL